MKKAAFLLVFVLSVSSAVFGAPADFLMGNPSNASADATKKDNFLMDEPYFTLSYNNSKGIPNWVSWRLVAANIGNVERVDAFRPDEALPRGFMAVVPHDYSNSGFDKGHMCNFKDRSFSEDAAKATFVMTNMVPQSKKQNEHTWEGLEVYCRGLALAGKHLYIVAGPAGQGGESVVHTIPVGSIGAKNKVAVPSDCWKVIMVVDGPGTDDIKKVNKNTRLIAVIMPNNEKLGLGWADYRVPVSAVEKLTGYKFFSTIPASIIEPLKAKVDIEPIAVAGHH